METSEEPESVSTASTFEIITHQKNRETQERASKRKRLVIFLLLIAVVVVIVVVVSVTVVLLLQRRTNDSTPGAKTDGSSSNYRSFIERFFVKVQDAYFESHPYMIVTKHNVTDDEIRARYRLFDYSPWALKKIADGAAKLRSEFSTIFTEEVKANLSERDLRAVYEMQQFLRHFGIGVPYISYYTGIWMLGPNIMVWEPIAHMWGMFEYMFSRHPPLRPRHLGDFEHILDLMSQFKDSISNYTENMRTGVTRGMVRNIEACKAGLKNFKNIYRSFTLYNETAVLSSGFLRPIFLEQITSEMRADWERTHNKSLSSSLKETLISCVGKPLTALIRYMENEHMRHCVPSNISSGLASLPLSHVYIDGVPDLSRKTNPYLPTGERLNGSFAFERILSYYTTTDVSAAELQAMGYEKLRSLKEQAVTLAKEVTKEMNATVAVQKFRQKLSMQSMYFNNETFPANESEENTYLKCYNDISAQRYCSKRWQAYNIWKNSTQKIQERLRQKIKRLFYTTGKRKTTLSCSAAISPTFHPVSSYHSYKQSGCGIHKLPFFIDNYGPKYSEWTVTAHETEPGHNLEVKGYYQNFYNESNDVINWLTDMTYFPAFSEGWATYAEYPLVGKDLDIYKDDLMSKYGMLQQQIMGALRLAIEPGLHSFGMSRSEALELFKESAWESGDIATKEITRYQSVQGQTVSYIFGQAAFMKARHFAEKELGSKFFLKEFHYQVLRQGEVTLGYLQKLVERYVDCIKISGDVNTSTICKQVLE